MSYAGSGGDDQSEDGELRHSPSDVKKGDDVLDFRLASKRFVTFIVVLHICICF